jgi:hypothetical protein
MNFVFTTREQATLSEARDLFKGIGDIATLCTTFMAVRARGKPTNIGAWITVKPISVTSAPQFRALRMWVSSLVSPPTEVNKATDSKFSYFEI